MSINDDILYKIDSEIGKDKKVVELRREIEDLTNSNNHWKKKCSEMGIALKTYEEGRYQEHLEIERLNNIIKEAREKVKERTEEVEDISWVEMKTKDYIQEQQELLEILKGD